MSRQEPKQQRSKETVDRLIDAAYNLFSSKGYQDVTTHEIAAEAGVSVGSFYTYFKDKKDILFALLQETSRGYEKLLKSVAEPRPREEAERALTDLIKVIIAVHEQNRGIAKTAEEMRYVDPDFYDYSKQYEKKFVDILISVLEDLERTQGIEITNVETKAKIIMVAVEAVCHENVFYDLGIDGDELVEELVRLIINYLEAS